MATVIAEVQSSRLAGFHRRNLGLFRSHASPTAPATRWLASGSTAATSRTCLRRATASRCTGRSSSTTTAGELQHDASRVRDPLRRRRRRRSALHTGRIVPIYEAAGKITTRVLRVLVQRVLESLPARRSAARVRARLAANCPDRDAAVRNLHFPPEGEDLRLLNAFRIAGAIPPDLRRVLLAGDAACAETQQGASCARASHSN